MPCYSTQLFLVICMHSPTSENITPEDAKANQLCSATGKVTLLSGQPRGGVPIEARSVSKGYFEETVADSSGNYRLRGLLPDTTYLIKVAKRDGVGSSFIERASPDSISVKVSC